MAPKKSSQPLRRAAERNSTSDAQPDPEEIKKSLAQWTDEQEIALLKAIVRWKPVGVHKNSRIIAVHNHMLGLGVVSPGDEHTSIPGLWTKLGSLYNLPVLDEREDSIPQSSSDENDSPQNESKAPSDLPEAEDGDSKVDKRTNPDGSESPSVLTSRQESTIAETDEPASFPAPGRRTSRATRRGGRVSKLQQEAAGSRRSSSSKAASVTEEDEIMEDAGDDDQTEEGSVEPDGEDDAEKESKGRPTTRKRGSTRGRGGRQRAAARAKGRKR